MDGTESYPPEVKCTSLTVLDAAQHIPVLEAGVQGGSHLQAMGGASGNQPAVWPLLLHAELGAPLERGLRLVLWVARPPLKPGHGQAKRSASPDQADRRGPTQPTVLKTGLRSRSMVAGS